MGGRHLAERSSDPRVAYPEVKVQVWDLVRVVIVLPPLPNCELVPGKNEACAGRPLQRNATGEPGKVQGRDHVGNVEKSCGYRARGVSIRGKSVLSRNLGYDGGRHVLNVVLKHPRVAYLCQSLGTGPNAKCGYFCSLCPTGGRYPGKIRFIEPQGVNGHRRPVPGAPSSGVTRESQAKFRNGTMWGL